MGGSPLLEIFIGPWWSVVPSLLVAVSLLGIILLTTMSLTSRFITGITLMVPPPWMWVSAHGSKPFFSLPVRNRMVVGPRLPSWLINSSSERIGWWVIGLISSSWW